MRIREYRGPLGILAAGAVGITLLCSVSAMAMTDLRNYIPATLVPMNIVELAIANVNTAVALTEQAVTQFVPTATNTIVPTSTPSLTSTPTDTPRRFVTITPTRTRRPREATPVPVIPPKTNTPKPVPTSTPAPTNTPEPTATDVPPPTDVPPTATDVPPTAIPPTATDAPTEPPPPTSLPVEQPMTDGQPSP